MLIISSLILLISWFHVFDAILKNTSCNFQKMHWPANCLFLMKKLDRSLPCFPVLLDNNFLKSSHNTLFFIMMLFVFKPQGKNMRKLGSESRCRQVSSEFSSTELIITKWVPYMPYFLLSRGPRTPWGHILYYQHKGQVWHTNVNKHLWKNR